MVSVPVIGLLFTVQAESDQSGIGVDLGWMDASQIIDEATNAHPAIEALPLGYIPIGMCFTGSGDYYFFRVSDGAVVRIPHTAVLDNGLNEPAVELVAPSIEHLLEVSEVIVRKHLPGTKGGPRG